MHRGPLLVNCVSARPARYLMAELEKAAEALKLTVRPVSRHELRCERDSAKFRVAIMAVHNVEGLLYISFRKEEGDAKRFH